MASNSGAACELIRAQSCLSARMRRSRAKGLSISEVLKSDQIVLSHRKHEVFAHPDKVMRTGYSAILIEIPTLLHLPFGTACQ